MLAIGDEYISARTGGSFRVVARDGKGMSFERVYKPNTGKVDPHRHLDFTQTWELLDGAATVVVDGERIAMEVGEPVTIPLGVGHRDPHTGDGEATVRGTFEPCPEFVEAYAGALAHHMQAGTTNRHDELPLLEIFSLTRETHGQSYRTGIPVVLQRGTLPLMAAVARRLGYRGGY